MPKTAQDLLLEAFLERQKSGSHSEFNSGILTADRYLKTLQECAGSDLCYRFAASKSSSFNDLIKKAASTLTYNNPDMVLEDNYSDWKKGFSAKDIYDDEVELPKDTLMVFRHVATSPRKDRDNDVLRTQGARPDPNMLLLWQHTHTLPIGKVLGTAEHTKDKLSFITALVDVNPLAHDSAVMIENKMGRFSHGFKALDFVKGKDASGKETGGFDIKQFEMMEVSLVSVPSNVDAEVEDVLLTLNSRGKFTSPLVKGFVNHWETQKTSTTVKSAGIPGNITININTSEKTVKVEEEDDAEIKSTKCGCGCNGAPGGCQSGKPKPAPEEGHADDGKKGSTDDKEMKCPECGKPMKDGKCSCGYTQKSLKSGRVISAATRERLSKIQGHLETLHDNEILMSPRGRQLSMEAIGIVGELSKIGIVDESEELKLASELTAKEAMAIFLGKCTPAESRYLLRSLQVLEKSEKATA